MKTLTTTQFKILGSKRQVLAVLRVKAAAAPVRKKRSIKDKIFIYSDIKCNWELKRGYKDTQNRTYNAQINLTEKSVRIFGEVEKSNWKYELDDNGEISGGYVNYMQDFDKIFLLHDYIKTGSYNLIYTNPITKISKSSVFADDKWFDLHTFIQYNWDLDLEKIAKHNTEEGYYI